MNSVKRDQIVFKASNMSAWAMKFLLAKSIILDSQKRKVQQQKMTYQDTSKPARVGKFTHKRPSISSAEWFLVNAISFTLLAFLSFSRADFLGTAFKCLLRCMKTLYKALQANVFPPEAVCGTSESLSASVVLLQSPSWLLMFWTSYLDKGIKAMNLKTLLRGVTKNPDATIGEV